MSTQTDYLELDLIDGDPDFDEWAANLNGNKTSPAKSNAQKIDNWASANRRSFVTIEIVVDDWSGGSCTKSVTGVSTTNNVMVSPAPDDLANFLDAEIICTAQGAGTLTFTCETTPIVSITVNVAIWGA